MEKLTDWWMEFLQSERNDGWWTRKKELYKARGVEMARIQGSGHVYQKMRYDHKTVYGYLLHLRILVKQENDFYLEEQILPFQFHLKDGEIAHHSSADVRFQHVEKISSPSMDNVRTVKKSRFSYDRLAAVKYAERWWNSYNPAYKKFDVDCTNYVSQCLHAGGAPMRGAQDRGQGWWYQSNNWSYSWAVAHSLRWYLSGSTHGLKGKEMEDASELMPGDVICYDFEGDGQWNHNTIVVAKDYNGMPLVNAHTSNSRHRYWSYEDSTAWTPNIKYKFFRIGE